MSRGMIRREVKRLESLMALPPPPPAPPVIAAALPAPQPIEPEKVEELTPEIIMVLSAAVAAFLGKRARIRSARLVRSAPSSAWAQQGRVFVQASHNLGVVHGR
jgi:methylmalonyl-CoA carboxyltransferase large subunit